MVFVCVNHLNRCKTSKFRRNLGRQRLKKSKYLFCHFFVVFFVIFFVISVLLSFCLSFFCHCVCHFNFVCHFVCHFFVISILSVILFVIFLSFEFWTVVLFVIFLSFFCHFSNNFRYFSIFFYFSVFQVQTAMLKQEAEKQISAFHSSHFKSFQVALSYSFGSPCNMLTASHHKALAFETHLSPDTQHSYSKGFAAWTDSFHFHSLTSIHHLISVATVGDDGWPFSDFLKIRALRLATSCNYDLVGC